MIRHAGFVHWPGQLAILAAMCQLHCHWHSESALYWSCPSSHLIGPRAVDHIIEQDFLIRSTLGKWGSPLRAGGLDIAGWNATQVRSV
eukprot:3849932-Rhodomonas_salina.1